MKTNHVMQDGTHILIKDMTTQQLRDTIELLKRKTVEGIKVYSGEGIASNDMWCNEYVLYGMEAARALNLDSYITELAKRDKAELKPAEIKGGIIVSIKLLTPSAILPIYSTKGSGAVDLHAAETRLIHPGETSKVHLGFAVAVPAGYGMLILSRSGLALASSVFVLNAPGLIDSDYRGEVGVIMHNAGKEACKVVKGARIAQALILPLPRIYWEETKELDSTVRGSGGFGHTGS